MDEDACPNDARPSLKRVFAIAAAPAITGWVASWISPFVATPLSFHEWSNPVVSLAWPICSVLVIVILGFCLFRPLPSVKRWSIYATLGLGVGIAMCLALRFVVKHFLREELVTTIIRDNVWRVSFFFMLLFMISTVVLWSIYFVRRGFDA